MNNLDSNIKALNRILLDKDRRVIAIYYDNVVVIDHIEKILENSFPTTKKHRINLLQYPQEQILDILNAKIKETTNAFIYIYGLEHLGYIFSEQNNFYTANQFFSILNLERERFFSQSNGKVIFFVKKHFLKQIKKNMPDFWDWIFYHFEFSINDFEITIKKKKSKKEKKNSVITHQRAKNLEKELRLLVRKKNINILEVLNKILILINYYIKEHKVSYASFWINKAMKYAINTENYQLIIELNERLADYFIKQKNWNEANKFLQKAIEYIEKYFFDKKSKYTQIYNKLAHVNINLGNLEKARENYLMIEKNRLDKKRVLDLTNSYSNLAKVLITNKDYKTALDYSLKALELRKKVLEHENKILAQNYYQIAQIYSQKKEFNLAKKYLTEAKKIVKKLNLDNSCKLVKNIETLFYNIS